MQLNMEQKNGVSVVRIEGDIDINTSPDVRKYFDKLVTEKKGNFVINLENVPYVDSSGLATLVEILKRVRATSGTLKLTNLSGKVLGLFEITKLNKLFTIAADEEEAIG